MVKVLEFGDLIQDGDYKVHSSFKNHINFISGNMLITLTDKPHDIGPLNIVLDSLTLTTPMELSIRKGEMLLNNRSYALTAEKRYSSDLKITSHQFRKFNQKLAQLELILIKHGSRDSLKFLLQESSNPSGTTFISKLNLSIQEGFSLMLAGKIAEGVKQIRGKGIGLTPSGDDLITGLLYGLYLIQNQDLDISPLRMMIYKNGKTGNLISENYISLAEKGSFFADLQQLIVTIIHGTDQEIEQKIRTFLMKGETSGADMLTGMVLAIKNMDLFLKYAPN
jgi:uncharacterized protein DUF2877